MIKTSHSAAMASCAAAMAFIAGCASAGGSHVRLAPRVFATASGDCSLVYLGGLGDVLRPATPELDRLERFLYGPAPGPIAPLRTPQGMTRIGSTLLICDQGVPDIIAFDLTTGRFSRWTRQGDEPVCPVAITTDGSSRVFVADTTRRAILVYDIEGRFLQELTPPGADVECFRPAAVCCDGQSLFIGDAHSGTIDRFDLGHSNWMTPWPDAESGHIAAPSGLALTPNGEWLVGDALRGMIHRLDMDGMPMAPLARRGRGRGECVRPAAIATLPSGAIVVVDSAKQVVSLFSDSGALLMEIPEANDDNVFTLPSGVTVIPPGVSLPLDDAVAALVDGVVLSYLVVSDAVGAHPLSLWAWTTPKKDVAK